MFFIKVGWRNILRHRRRSLVTLLAIVTGLVGIIAFGGFVQANYEGLRESVIRSQYGHLQLFRAGYEANHRQQPERSRPRTPAASRRCWRRRRTLPWRRAGSNSPRCSAATS